MYQVTKTYDHNAGLSACFRQWRTDTHCRFLHGYALAVTLTFSCEILDRNNWVINFGALKPVKALLENTFDHKTLVAKDDPAFNAFREMQRQGLIQMVVVEGTGCEMFARLIADEVTFWLSQDVGFCDREVRLVSVRVSEHGGNSAIYLC